VAQLPDPAQDPLQHQETTLMVMLVLQNQQMNAMVVVTADGVGHQMIPLNGAQVTHIADARNDFGNYFNCDCRNTIYY
jgi:hypothetical protein